MLDRIERRPRRRRAARASRRCGQLFEAALYVGRLSREVSAPPPRGARRGGADGTATFILGGQIGGAPPDILLVYPEGNYIRASDDRPFLQIGESKYGKFMLELAVRAPRRPGRRDQDRARVDDEHRARQPLGRAALRPRRLPQRALRARRAPLHRRLARARRLREVWERNILRAVAELPDVELSELSDETAAQQGVEAQ